MSAFRSAALAVLVLLGAGAARADGVFAGYPYAQTPVPPKVLALWGTLGAGGGKLAAYKPAHPPGYYAIGTAPTQDQIAGWSIAVAPNGAGLPPGQGTADQGSTLFSTVCATCHGTFGEGGNGYPQLLGGMGSLGTLSQVKTPANYWPFATTIFDYINRAMPFYAPHRFPPDQIYALTAFILNSDGVVPANFVANAKTLPLVKMPNRDGFLWQDPRPVTHATACMTKCADPAKITVVSNAATMKLTPLETGPVDHMKGHK
ncbi:MAG: cytochrome c [Rhodospirillales bacterium]|nr:cytochrome c [Rhodospirillales bacterium]